MFEEEVGGVELVYQWSPLFSILARAMLIPKFLMVSCTLSPVLALTSSAMYPFFSAIFLMRSGLTTLSQSDLFPSSSTLMDLSQ